MSLFKWALGLLGAYIGGLPGGLLGYWLGSKLDKTDEENLKDTVLNSPLTTAHCPLTTDHSQFSTLNSQFKNNSQFSTLNSQFIEADAKKILRLLRQMVKPTVAIELEPACDAIRKHTDYTTRYHMVDFLFRLAMADGAFDGRENKTIQTIARHLNITQGDYVSMFSRHTAGAEPRRDEEYKESSRGAPQEQRSGNPYSVLGITNGATDDEVKKAYRRMAMRYHPDKVENLGEEMKRNATEQFRAINEAYETIKTERGIN